MNKSKESNFVSNVIYIRNAEKNIAQFLENVYKVIKSNFKSYEFVFVNDCSEDNGVKVIKDFFAKRELENAVTIINMSKFHGKELAMAAGLDVAIGDYIFEFDEVIVDYPSNVIMDVYYKCMSGIDIVKAVSKKKRKLSSRLFYYLYNNLQVGRRIDLDSEMFCIISRRAINRVNAMTKSVPYRKVLYAQCGLPIDKLEYDAIDEVYVVNKESEESKNRFNLAIDTLLLFTNIIDRISILLSVFFLGFSVVVGIYVCIVYFGENKPVEGWAPMMGFLSVAFSGVFLFFSVVVKYLVLILNMIFVNEKYLVESVEKL